MPRPSRASNALGDRGQGAEAERGGGAASDVLVNAAIEDVQVPADCVGHQPVDPDGGAKRHQHPGALGGRGDSQRSWCVDAGQDLGQAGAGGAQAGYHDDDAEPQSGSGQDDQGQGHWVCSLGARNRSGALNRDMRFSQNSPAAKMANTTASTI